MTVGCGSLTHGFVDETNRLVMVTGEDISGQKASTRDMRKMPARRKRQIDPLGRQLAFELGVFERFLALGDRGSDGLAQRMDRILEIERGNLVEKT